MPSDETLGRSSPSPALVTCGRRFMQGWHPGTKSDYSEREPLKTAHEGREHARIEREEYLKANPPQPKDITLNFWRTEKPATNGKGVSK